MVGTQSRLLKGKTFAWSVILAPPFPLPSFSAWLLWPQRPAFVGHSFGGGTVLQVLSDDRERGSNVGVGPEEDVSGYSVAFIMDAWTYPCSDEARTQSVDIPVREGRFPRRSTWWDSRTMNIYPLWVFSVIDERC